jgi:DNA repair exonuclease SbcCD ATPase subunit
MNNQTGFIQYQQKKLLVKEFVNQNKGYFNETDLYCILPNDVFPKLIKNIEKLENIIELNSKEVKLKSNEQNKILNNLMRKEVEPLQKEINNTQSLKEILNQQQEELNEINKKIEEYKNKNELIENSNKLNKEIIKNNEKKIEQFTIKNSELIKDIELNENEYNKELLEKKKEIKEKNKNEKIFELKQQINERKKFIWKCANKNCNSTFDSIFAECNHPAYCTNCFSKEYDFNCPYCNETRSRLYKIFH